MLLRFDRAYLADATTLESALSFATSGRSDTRSKAGEVREYANGCLRAVSGPTRRQSLDVTARAISRVELERLEALTGRLVLFRDAWGRKVWGTYFALDVTDYKDRTTYDVSFTLERVSKVEAV